MCIENLDNLISRLPEDPIPIILSYLPVSTLPAENSKVIEHTWIEHLENMRAQPAYSSLNRLITHFQNSENLQGAALAKRIHAYFRNWQPFIRNSGQKSIEDPTVDEMTNMENLIQSKRDEILVIFMNRLGESYPAIRDVLAPFNGDTGLRAQQIREWMQSNPQVNLDPLPNEFFWIDGNGELLIPEEINQFKALTGLSLAECFVQAAQTGQTETISSVINTDRFKEIRASDFHHVMPYANLGLALTHASADGHHQIVQMLINSARFGEIEASYMIGGISSLQNAIEAAISYGHHQIVQMFIGCGRFQEIPANCLAYMLVEASSAGYHKIVQMLIDCGRFQEIRNSVDASLGKALLEASTNGHHQIVQMLIDCPRFAEIPALGEFETTLEHSLAGALLMASKNGHHQIVQMLINCERFEEIPASGKYSLEAALSSACHRGDDDEIEQLIQAIPSTLAAIKIFCTASPQLRSLLRNHESFRGLLARGMILSVPVYKIVGLAAHFFQTAELTPSSISLLAAATTATEIAAYLGYRYWTRNSEKTRA